MAASASLAEDDCSLHVLQVRKPPSPTGADESVKMKGVKNAPIAVTQQQLQQGSEDRIDTVDPPCPFCGDIWDGKRCMVQCDMCSCWVHNTCLQMDDEIFEELDRCWCWHCPIPQSARSHPLTIGSDKKQMSGSTLPKRIRKKTNSQNVGNQYGTTDHSMDAEQGQEDTGIRKKGKIVRSIKKGQTTQTPPSLGARVTFKWNEYEWYEGTLLERRAKRAPAKRKKAAAHETEKDRRLAGHARRNGKQLMAGEGVEEWWLVLWDLDGTRSLIRLDASTEGRWKVLTTGAAVEGRSRQLTSRKKGRQEGATKVEKGTPATEREGLASEVLLDLARLASWSDSSKPEDVEDPEEFEDGAVEEKDKDDEEEEADRDRDSKGERIHKKAKFSRSTRMSPVPMAEYKGLTSTTGGGRDFSVKVMCYGGSENKGKCFRGTLKRSTRRLGMPVVKVDGDESTEFSLLAFEELAGSKARRPRTTIQIESTGQPIGPFLDILGL